MEVSSCACAWAHGCGLDESYSSCACPACKLRRSVNAQHGALDAFTRARDAAFAYAQRLAASGAEDEAVTVLLLVRASCDVEDELDEYSESLLGLGMAERVLDKVLGAAESTPAALCARLSHIENGGSPQLAAAAVAAPAVSESAAAEQRRAAAAAAAEARATGVAQRPAEAA